MLCIFMLLSAVIVGVKKGKSEQKKFEFYIVEKENKSNDL